MGHDPISLDELVRRTGWSAAELNVRLLELELDGQVARLPGQCFQRIAQG
jgi:DNA processing protein